MGLVGRLDDLPIADIVQIVYLSRGSGVLDLRVADGRHSIMFSKGLMVNAASPLIRTLRADLEGWLNAGPINRLIDASQPVGVAALDKNLIKAADLGRLMFQRIAMVVRGLTDVRKGEFEFVSREPTLAEVEYLPLRVFKRGGIRPEDIFGKRAAGLGALSTVKESLKNVGERSAPAAAAVNTQPTAPIRPPDRCLIVVESEATTRDAIRHAAGVHGFHMVQAADPRNAAELLDHEGFFVAVLDLGSDPETTVFRVIREIKLQKAHVPIIVLDGTSDFRRRHQSLESGADLYMRKPADGAAEESSIFAEDLMLFVERRFAERKPDIAGAPMHRGFRLLVQLLEEISNPGDTTQLSLTILQLAADYVDRGVLFARKGDQMVMLGKFGVRGNGATPRISLLDRVITTRKPFRGAVEGAIAAELESAFGAASVREAIALPMMSGKEVVGVLYGDNAVNNQPIEDTLGLEVFLSQAGFAFENVGMNGRSLVEKLHA